MQKLNFPEFEFRFKKNTQNEVFIFDESRKKFIFLTPEEWVRQHALKFLLKEKRYPISLIEVEKGVSVNGQTKRFDLICKNSDGTTYLLLECKAPEVEITQATFDQIIRYNNTLVSSLIWITNGLKNCYYKFDENQKKYIKINKLPLYSNETIS